MVKIWLRYSDGKTTEREFPNRAAAVWFINNEGDHLLEVRWL